MRIDLLATTALLLATLHSAGKTGQEDHDASARPNVLFIVVDDLNDWIGCLGGHPQALTPNIDRLAERGILFTNAQCQAPSCNPSRASLMSSLYPSSSGIYFLRPELKASPAARKSVWMPRRFRKEGFFVSGAGKLFHLSGEQNERFIPNYAGGFGHFGPAPIPHMSSYPGTSLWDWGAYPRSDEEMPDFKLAQWAKTELSKKRRRPFWLGVGFYRPHVPMLAPKKWFDMHPLDEVRLPNTLADDLADISQYGLDITRLEHTAPTFDWAVENDEWKPMVQAYLACSSFVDAQVGTVLDALARSPNAETTHIVLLGDHGFHLGEKERFGKLSLWEDGARTPLIIAGPGIVAGGRCSQPVQLLDIYPTLLDLLHLEPDPKLEGRSIVPLLKDPHLEWPYMARVCLGPGNYAIVSERYRYIRYDDGSEEFYDIQEDPNEWKNLAADPNYTDLVAEHRAKIPEKRHKILGEGSVGHRSYAASEAHRREGDH